MLIKGQFGRVVAFEAVVALSSKATGLLKSRLKASLQKRERSLLLDRLHIVCGSQKLKQPWRSHKKPHQIGSKRGF